MKLIRRASDKTKIRNWKRNIDIDALEDYVKERVEEQVLDPKEKSRYESKLWREIWNLPKKSYHYGFPKRVQKKLRSTGVYSK